MKKTTIAAALLALALGALTALAGCNSDPHDTHTTVTVAPPR